MPKRLERDVAIARANMANVRVDLSYGLAGIHGGLILPKKYGDGVRDVFSIQVLYPPDFLHAYTEQGFQDGAPTYPTVYLMSHRRVWAKGIDGHILRDWALCLYVPGECDIDFRDHHSFDQLLAVTKTFLVTERIYQRRLRQEKETGIKAVWPGPQREHGIAGYADAVRDRGGLRDHDYCICGSPVRYARCHKEHVVAFESARAAAVAA